MNFAAFHFAEPGWLWLALLAPICLIWLHWRAGRQRVRQLAQMASPHFVRELTASHSPGKRWFKEILIVVIFILAGVALARPQWGSVQTSKTWLGEDMVFVVDCSLSMTTSDVLPSRLQRAKYAVLDFVRRQSHGRVGLVAFAGRAFIQCPLTFDADAFEEDLLALDEHTIPLPGTDIGLALKEAYLAMDKNSRHKMMVLVTDGEDLEKAGVAEAKTLATNGVVVFTVGVGTPAGQEIQVQNPSGQMELLRDSSGQVVESRLDESTLKEIAQVTGGSYYPLGPQGDGLMKVSRAIHTLETANGLQQAMHNGVDHFFWPLAGVLVLLIIESLLSTRRRHLPGTP